LYLAFPLAWKTACGQQQDVFDASGSRVYLACQQAIAHAGRIAAGFIVHTHGPGLLLTLMQVGIDLGAVPQIMGKHGIDIG
jgi:hypothetical protein